MRNILWMLSLLFSMATVLTAEGADNQKTAGTYGFESILLGTPFDKANTYIQTQFAFHEIMTKTDSIKKARTLLIEGYDLNGKTSFMVDVILFFDRNDIFIKCEMEGPNRISDPKLLAADVSSFLDVLKHKYGEKYQQETIGGQGFYRWSLGTAQVSLTTIQSKEFQFAKASIFDLSLVTKQDECEKAEEEKTKGKSPVKSNRP